jgi:hypothetical protein
VALKVFAAEGLIVLKPRRAGTVGGRKPGAGGAVISAGGLPPGISMDRSVQLKLSLPDPDRGSI